MSNLGRNITSVTINNGPKPVFVHNMASKTSIICGQGPIRVEHSIPLSGNHFSTNTRYKEDTTKIKKTCPGYFNIVMAFAPKTLIYR
jgi:hypothetical protein